jgi:hypothetical protein
LAISYIWRLRWRYTDASGKLMPQAELSADFILNGVIDVGDGTLRPDMNDAKTKVGNNFPTPTGGSILFTGVSSSQAAFAYS